MATELTRTLKALPADPGHRIKVALAFHQRTQSDLARAVGSDVTKVSRALNGYRAFSDAERVKVAEYLDLPLALVFPQVA